MTNLAFFITSHGFGHASRASAVINALASINKQYSFTIVTSIPEWFLQRSLEVPFEYLRLETDVGLIQQSPMHENLEATFQTLDSFYPISDENIHFIGRLLKRNNVSAVCCDIAPMGIEIGRALDLPSILIENFTWDWILSGYPEYRKRLQSHINYFEDVFTTADLHLQAQPNCNIVDTATTVEPISRKPRSTVEHTRDELNVDINEPLVMITMGGIKDSTDYLAQLSDYDRYRFLIPGGGDEYTADGNLILLPHHSRFYHPDLIRASDAIVGKLGYSTLAEVYHADIPFLYVPRPTFPESPPMEAFVNEHMISRRIDSNTFKSCNWVEHLPEVLSYSSGKAGLRENGADSAARHIHSFLQGL